MNLDRAKEKWRPIPGFEGLYDVSTFGHVRRSLLAPPSNATIPGRIIGDGRPDSTSGYMRASLRKGGVAYRYQVHRLVALAFMEPATKHGQINHKDGNKTNNKLENLEWATAQENVRHAWRIGLCHAVKGSKHGMSVLTDESVKIILSAVVRGIESKQIAEVFNITTSNVSAIASGKTWKHLHKENHVA